MRGQGEGSIYRRGDGYWVGQVELGHYPNGRRRRARVVRRYRANVVDALDEVRRQVRDGVVPDRTRSSGQDGARALAARVGDPRRVETTERARPQAGERRRASTGHPRPRRSPSELGL